MFIDFAALKAATTMADMVSMLDLKLKQAGNQWRGVCPFCKTGGERALVITEGRGFYCFAAKKGGDQIALYAHITDANVKDAADAIATWKGLLPRREAHPTLPGIVSPPESESGSGTKKLAPLSYLEPEHDAVVALGFNTDFCKAHGIGYAGRGMMRGMIAVPFRDERGNLLGYIGIEDCKLPPDFIAGVIPLRKSA
jgi:hypothetical protein